MKYKLLYISAVIPDTTSGGRFAMYRHLIVKSDFEVAVASFNYVKLPITFQLVIDQNRLVKRLKRTRLSRFIHNLEYLLNWFIFPNSLLKFVNNFQPDAIVSVVDDWHVGLAFQLSRKLGIPLVIDFQDLFCLSQFISIQSRPYPWIQKWLISRYQLINNIADQVFYTSRGMQNWFAPVDNGDILYPIGDFKTKIFARVISSLSDSITIVYAGNCYGAYGRMLLRLAEASKKYENINLKIFAAGNDWSTEKITEMRNLGIYQGFKPFEELRDELEQADAFLTVMSFEEPEKIFVQTSFTTKWLDYVPYGKPVFVWAPPYSTAYQFADEYHAGSVVGDDSPEMLLENIAELASDISKWNSLCKSSADVAKTVLNSENIHNLFVERVRSICKKRDAVTRF